MSVTLSSIADAYSASLGFDYKILHPWRLQVDALQRSYKRALEFASKQGSSRIAFRWLEQLTLLAIFELSHSPTQ